VWEAGGEGMDVFACVIAAASDVVFLLCTIARLNSGEVDMCMLFQSI
jgi:hypothetical protein